MTYHSQHSIVDILANTALLRAMQEKADILTTLNQRLAQFLPSPLSLYCQVANLREGTLIVTASAPCWHHQLRYHQAELLKFLQQDPSGQDIVRIQCKVNLDNKPNISSPPPGRVLSNQNGELIKAAAKGACTPALQKSLLRLLRHLPSSN